MDATCVRVADAEGRRFVDVLEDSYAATLLSFHARADVARVDDAVRDLGRWELARLTALAVLAPGEFERERQDAVAAVEAASEAAAGGGSARDRTPEELAMIADEIETLRQIRDAREAAGTFAERWARARGRAALSRAAVA